jgi:hypothetical protein
VQAVGKLNQNHPDILGHGHNHLAEAFCLTFFTIVKGKFAQLGDTANQRRDFTAKEFD